jgi:hypothetical protein
LGNKALVVARFTPPTMVARLATFFPITPVPIVSALPLKFAEKLRLQNWIVKP